MTGTPWAVCDRRHAHGQHDWVTSTTLGEQREHVCPGVVSDKAPANTFFRQLLGVRPPRPTLDHLAKPTSTEAKHRADGHIIIRSYPATFAPRHCAGPTPDHGCLHNHAGASTPLPPMAFVDTWFWDRREPHRCGDGTCTEDHGTETSRIQQGAAS